MQYLKSPIFFAVFLFVVSTSIFLRGLNYPLLLDDLYAVKENPCFEPEVHISCIFTSNNWGGHEKNPYPLYRPVSSLSIGLTASFTKDIRILRIQNAVIYGLLCVSVFVFFIRLGLPLFWSFFGAFWFSLHPVHVEAVRFIVNREEMLASLFVVLALAYTARKQRLSFYGYVMVLLLSMLAVFSKESAFTIFLLLPLFALGPQKQRALLFLLGLFSVCMSVACRWLVLGRWFPDKIAWQDNPLLLVSGIERLYHALRLIPPALNALFLPTGFAVDYSFDVLGIPREQGTLEALSGLFALVFAGFLALKSEGLARKAVLFALVSYFPVSSLVVPSTIIFSERGLLPCSIGCALLVALLFQYLWLKGKSFRRAGAFLILCWSLFFFWKTWARSEDFSSAIKLYSSSLSAFPNSSRLHNNLGLALWEDKRLEDAELHFRKALSIDPQNFYAHQNLGLLLAHNHRFFEAEAHFREALRFEATKDKALSSMCILLVQMGRYQEALDFCEQLPCNAPPEAKEALRFLQTDGRCGWE